MTPIVWIWNIGTRLPAISEFATMTRARQTEISVSPVIFESFVTRLTRGKSCHFDGWNNILRDILSRILSSFCRVKILPFFFFLPMLCYPRGSMVRFIVPNFSKNRVSMQAFLSKCAGNGMIYSSQGGFNWEEFRFWLV